MAWYAKVENNEVVKIRIVDPSDSVLIAKLVAHGYRIGEDGDSSYDPITQTRATMPTYDVQAKVVRTYAVSDKPLETVRAAKLTALYANVKQFISYQPNGWPRYDQDLKMNIMNAIMDAVAAGDPVPANCTTAKNWILAVQTYFFTLKAAIVAAETVSALRTIDVSYDHFETKYGREGNTLPDPAISTDDLFPE